MNIKLYEKTFLKNKKIVYEKNTIVCEIGKGLIKTKSRCFPVNAKQSENCGWNKKLIYLRAKRHVQEDEK